MADTQAKKLVDLVRKATISDLEVFLPPFEVKKSALGKICVGDIVMLPLKKIKVLVCNKEQDVLAQGLYGMERGTPAVLITDGDDTPYPHIDSKKYEFARISLGSAENERLQAGSIIRLNPKNGYMAMVYLDDARCAYGNFVQAEEYVAIEIQRVG